MDNKTILSHVDHTLLKPTASWEEIIQLCEAGVRHRTASVCIPPAYVARVKEMFDHQLTICTVIGFPLGYQTTEIKVTEAAAAVAAGAAEIDMVVNLGDVKNGMFEAVTREISEIKRAIGHTILKVIVETCYLTEREKIALCRCVTDGGGDFIKTSTGFGTAGAVLEDILLFKEHLGKGIRIKAAGGIKSKDDLEKFIMAGCDRIGTSSAVALLSGEAANGY